MMTHRWAITIDHHISTAVLNDIVENLYNHIGLKHINYTAEQYYSVPEDYDSSSPLVEVTFLITFFSFEDFEEACKYVDKRLKKAFKQIELIHEEENDEKI